MSLDYKYYLAQLPLVKLAFPFVFGIILGIYTPFQKSIYWFIIGLLLCLVLSLLTRLNFSLKNLQLKTLFSSILLWVSIFFTGAILSEFHKQIERKNHFSKHFENDDLMKIQIINPVNLKSKSAKIEAKVLTVIKQNSATNTSGKILLYLEKDSLAEHLQYGDILIIKTRVNELSPPMNPHEFDYKQYMSFKNIYHQTYANKNSWIHTEKNIGNKFLSSLYKLRNHLSNVINIYLVGNDEKAIANAILIGNKDLLDDKITKAYATSGAMHVLAVSGLHVGIIYVIFSYLLSFLKRTKFKSAFPFVLIILIWFYALITGGSPSVLRAATMFSFITIGASFNRNLSIYNAIGASIIVLVSINPFIITEVGFQLSYLAVIGIIFLQPKIYKFYLPKNKIIDNIWAITAVSIAAQIATFPLGVLYFHQFPNLFWVSNLIVIPAATIIVYGGVLLFVFSWWNWAALIIGKILNFIILLLNKCVNFIDQIPYSLTSGLDITVLETYYIFGIIVGISLAFAFRLKIAFFTAIAFLFIFSISFAAKNIERINQKKIIVYHTPKQSSIEFISSKKAVSIFDENLLSNESQLLFRVKHNWWSLGLKNHYNIDNNPILKSSQIGKNKLIYFEKTKVLMIDSIYEIPDAEFEVDFAIISNNPKVYLNKFTQNIKAKQFVFDSSNPAWKIKYWKKDCEDLQLNCYFVTEEKAFVANL